MIRKPAGDWGREHRAVATLRSAATSGSAVVTKGVLYTRALILWFFALLWGFAALMGGLFMGNIPMFVILGGAAAALAWFGRRLVQKATAA
jgi:hypothetical protein